jgi:APA family basic amino acid/polyamine antiporter
VSVASSKRQFLQSLSISVGMAFATSCFAMLAGMAGAAGALVVPAIAFSALIGLAVAHAIGRLAKRFPSALGIRTYLKAAFGNTTSLFFVFLYLLMIGLIAGVESNMYASIVGLVAPGLDARLIIVAIFAVVIAMNVFGFEFSKQVQLCMVGAMLAGVFALSVFALAQGDPAPLLHPQVSAVQAAAAPTAIVSAFFLFVGFEWVTSAQSSSRSAAAQLPWVLLASIALLGCMYLLFALGALAHLSPAEWAATDKPQMLLAAKLWGKNGTWFMLAMSTCAVLTAFNAGVLGAARLLYALAREGVLPAVLGTTARFSAAPVAAIAATAILSLLSALLAHALHNTYLLGSIAAVIICLCYSALLAASLALHRHGGAKVAQALEALALLAMLGLLGALLLQPGAARQSAIACAAVGVVFALAVLANRRGASGSASASTSASASFSRPSIPQRQP